MRWGEKRRKQHGEKEFPNYGHTKTNTCKLFHEVCLNAWMPFLPSRSCLDYRKHLFGSRENMGTFLLTTYPNKLIHFFFDSEKCSEH